jgi:hypothetical protein
MLLDYLYNLYIFTELDFAWLQLIYVGSKLAVGIRFVYPLHTLNICLQYIGFGDYLYTIDLFCEWDEYL